MWCEGIIWELSWGDWRYLTYFSGFCRKFAGSYLRGWERSFPTDLSHLWSVENPNPVIHLIMNESEVALLLERSRYLIRSKYWVEMYLDDYSHLCNERSPQFCLHVPFICVKGLANIAQLAICWWYRNPTWSQSTCDGVVSLADLLIAQCFFKSVGLIFTLPEKQKTTFLSKGLVS